MHIENQRHLFWECINVQSFWVNLSNKMNSINFKIEFNYQTISFGILKLGDNNTTRAKNYIILSAKYFIFKKKCLNEIPIANEFISYLHKQIEIERSIAFEKGKLAIQNIELLKTHAVFANHQMHTTCQTPKKPQSSHQ